MSESQAERFNGKSLECKVSAVQYRFLKNTKTSGSSLNAGGTYRLEDALDEGPIIHPPPHLIRFYTVNRPTDQAPHLV